MRRQRFKVGVYISLGGMAVLLTGSLIEGCQRQQSASVAPADPAPELAAPLTQTGRVAEPSPETNLSPSAMPTEPAVTAAPPAAATAPSAASTAAMNEPPTAAPAASVADAVYVIKRGDTLGRIAKAHGTTIAAIKEANGLKSDRIIAGHKLKLPTTAPAPVL